MEILDLIYCHLVYIFRRVDFIKSTLRDSTSIIRDALDLLRDIYTDKIKSHICIQLTFVGCKCVYWKHIIH